MPHYSLCTALLLLSVPTDSVAASDPLHDVVSAGGVVVSVEAHASRVGLEVLRAGGHAVDAAVATAFALAVTHPAAGNIGGGGFMMVHLADSGQAHCVEYRETAPRSATPEIIARLNDTSRGALSAGVPGTVRGLALAHERFGRRPWKELLDPAVQLARDGFPIDPSLARSLNGWLRQAAPFAEAQRVFAKPDATAWQPGDRLVQPDLARTLEQIRDHGGDAFYRGTIAQQIVAEMKNGGGLITPDDLAGYQANLRVPIRGTYRGHQVLAPPPPSSGGIVLVEMLNMLEHFDLKQQGRDAPATVHQFAEVMRRGYFDRAMHIADPAFSDVPVDRLTSKEYAHELARNIAAAGERAGSSESLGKDVLEPAEREHTTHFSVIDRHGNAVANTYTLQDSYGSFVVVSGAGFLLNNEMTDFNLQPGVTDRRGKIGTPPNVVAPGKRMLSSQTPTIVLKDGKPLLITGSPGGRTIINTVLGIVTNVIDFGMSVREAVDAPRMHHQWMPDVLRLERGRVPAETQAKLEAMGHRIETVQRQGDAHTIWIDPATGRRHGAADRRLSGHAAGE